MNVRSVLPKDAIQSIDDPAFGASYFGAPDDEVLVLEGSPPRAYPLRVLAYHEIVNDVVDGDPVAVTWCPICWSAVAYDRTVDGRTLSFGVSGDLADDTLVVYDRETDSRWKQSSGECIDGEFLGRRLTARPAAVHTYARFRETHPDGLVLQPVRGGDDGPTPAAAYDMAPYERYRDADGFGLAEMRGQGEQRPWTRDDLGPKDLVLGVGEGADAVGYPLSRVRDAGGVVTDTVGDRAVVVFATESGGHVYRNPDLSFEREGAEFVADGTTWDPATGRSADGRALERVPARLLFAFTWQDDHGPDAFWG